MSNVKIDTCINKTIENNRGRWIRWEGRKKQGREERGEKGRKEGRKNKGNNMILLVCSIRDKLLLRYQLREILGGSSWPREQPPEKIFRLTSSYHPVYSPDRKGENRTGRVEIRLQQRR